MVRTRDRHASLPEHDFLLDENVPSVHQHATERPQLSDLPAPLTPRAKTSAIILTSPHLPTSSPQTPPPSTGVVQSAPATHPVTRYRSTPIKRKACSIPLALLPMRSASIGKRRRLTSQVLPLLQDELHGRWYSYENFLTDFVHYGPWALSDTQVIDLLGLLSQDSPNKGITYDPITDVYCCTPPGFADIVFSGWFCDLGNAILRMSKLNPKVHTNSTVTSALGKAGDTLQPTAQCPSEYIQENLTHGSPDTTPTPGGVSWVSCRTSSLRGFGKSQIRPDFVLTSNSVVPTWSTILVVGEHHSVGKTEEAAKLQLASYVEQVFIAQPFRMAIIGILTSNSGTLLRLWRFDRAGAVGSLNLNYSSTASSCSLASVVQCLYSLTTSELQATWFHTKSVSWVGPKKPDWCTVGPTNEELATEKVLLNKRIFTAGGIVSRGTCVWEGTLRATSRVVAVKYSWQNTKRTSEAEAYSVAHSKGVVGLPKIISHDEYGDIHTIVRRGLTPCTLCDHDMPTLPEKSAVDAYTLFVTGCNRYFTRLVLGTIGKSISDPSLSPLQIARSLLAGIIAHASLFFQGGILHRDVSINNIIAISSPLATVPGTPPTIDGEFLYTPGTDLYGCLIDLDYAVVVTEQDTSGIPERTGTYPFIAIAILQGKARHRYRHDLESFLYVLLWVACYPVASTQSSILPAPPEDVHQQDRWPPNDPLKAWSCESEAIVASLKCANIVNSEDIFEELLERFRPGFERFKYAAREMRLALWELHHTGNCIFKNEGTGTEESTARAGRRQGRKPGKTLGAGDVRIGVSNWEGFCDIRSIFEELVHALEKDATVTNGQYGEHAFYN
ncbi:hypothetical protein BGX38DRAFT_780685 [Terfezia claveryi]|nr:hypothetical protein BGX38DRAFT_780685 [Terfezia claveryi]